MAKEVMNETVVGLALVISFVLIVSLAAAEIPEPPPIPSALGDGSSAEAPSTPGTPGEEDGGAPLTPGVPPSPSADSGGSSGGTTGGGGDYGRRRAGDTYSYGDGSVGDSSGAIETAPRAPPADSSSGYIPEVSDDATEQRQETIETATTQPSEKKGYIWLIILTLLILLAIGAIIWAVMRWQHHHIEESAVHKEMESAEKNLYLKKDTPKSPKKPAGKGPLPPGMR